MFTTKNTRSATYELVELSQRNTSNTNDTDSLYQVAEPFSGVVFNTGAYLSLLKCLPVKDLHSMMLVSKTFMKAFIDTKIYEPLKSFVYSTNQGNLRELNERYDRVRRWHRHADVYDRLYKNMCCQRSLSHFIYCCYVSRNDASEFSNVRERFPQQHRCTVLFWLLMATLILVPSSFSDTDQLRHEHAQLFPANDVWTSISSLAIIISCCSGIGCWGYTSCIRPTIDYCQQRTRLNEIQTQRVTTMIRDGIFSRRNVAEEDNLEEELLSMIEIEEGHGEMKTP